MRQPSDDPLETRWSMIGRLQGEQMETAWTWFIDRYRPAIRSTLRQWLGQARAEEVVDGFWGYLYTSKALHRADPDRRLRHFLWGVARNYARKHLPKDRAQELPDVELPGKDESSDTDEMRHWTIRVLELALERLRRPFPEDAFALEAFYGLGGGLPTKAKDLAEQLGKKPNALHQLLHRARKRLREFLLAELRETVGTPTDLDQEVRLVLEGLGTSYPGLISTRHSSS